MKKSIRRDI